MPILSYDSKNLKIEGNMNEKKIFNIKISNPEM